MPGDSGAKMGAEAEKLAKVERRDDLTTRPGRGQTPRFGAAGGNAVAFTFFGAGRGFLGRVAVDFGAFGLVAGGERRERALEGGLETAGASFPGGGDARFRFGLSARDIRASSARGDGGSTGLIMGCDSGSSDPWRKCEADSSSKCSSRGVSRITGSAGLSENGGESQELGEERTEGAIVIGVDSMPSEALLEDADGLEKA